MQKQEFENIVTDKKVIILIGAARSGTKFLRSILDASNQVSAIPYDVNYIWRFGNEQLVHDELTAGQLNEKTRAYIHKQLYRISGIGDDDKQVLLEKTVSNSLRVPFVNKVFPNALYIHLIRDGRAVTESAMRMWNAPPELKSIFQKLRKFPLSNIGYIFWFLKNFVVGLTSSRRGGNTWGPRYQGLDEDVRNNLPLVEICAKQWVASITKAAEDLDKIDASRVLTLRYSDLISNDKSIDALLNFANIDDKTLSLEYYRNNVRKGNDDKWGLHMDKNEISSMNNILNATLKKFDF